MNFTWAFLSSVTTRVEWGLAATPYAFDSPPGLLVSFFKGNPLPVTPPAAYTGRVSGRHTGNQVTFTLRNISKLDGRLYGCLITDTTDPDDISSFDPVTLEVEGARILSYAPLVTRTRRFRIKIPLAFKAENSATIFHSIKMSDCFWQMRILLQLIGD